MDSKTQLITIAVVVIVIATAGGTAFALMNDNGNNNGDNTKISDATTVAISFAAYYSGDLGSRFDLSTDSTTAKATIECSNGTSSSYTSSTNYVIFTISDDAQGDFNTNKTDYESQVGESTMGGAIYTAVTDKSDLTDAYGYYANIDAYGVTAGTLYYSGYLYNVFFESYMYVSGALDNEDFAILAKAICDSIKNTCTGNADAAASSFATGYGSGNLGTFTVSGDNTCVSAKAAYDNGNTSDYGSSSNYVWFTVESDSSDSFSTYKTDFSSQIGKTVMGSEIKEITTKGSLTDAYGYYNNYSMYGSTGSYMYYAGYYENIVVYVYISLDGTLAENDFTTLAENISAAAIAAC